MTLRHMWLALALGMTACSGGGGGGDNGGDKNNTGTKTDTNNGGDDDDSSSTPTGETGTTGGTPTGPFEPTALSVSAQLFYDSASGSLVTATQGTNSFDSFIFVLFGDDAWVQANEDQSLVADYCYIEFPLTSAVPASWALANPNVFFGVDYTGGVDAADGNCGDADHPLDNLSLAPGATTDQLIDLVVNGGGPWGVGVGKPTPNFDDITSTDLSATYLGGYMPSVLSNPASPPPGGDSTNHWYVAPLVMDPTTFEIDNTATIPVNQVFDGTSLATGAYLFNDFYALGL